MTGWLRKENLWLGLLLAGAVGICAGAAGADSVAVWGDNQYGQIGDGTNNPSLTPLALAGLPDVAAVAGGGFHTVALLVDGTVRTWGRNARGQLGDGTTVDSPTPLAVPGLTGVVAVAAGYEYTLALLNDGTVWAWGANDSGQLGDGTTTDQPTPGMVTGISGVTGIAAGKSHSLAVLSDGTLRSWGANAFGQLGDGTTVASLLAATVSGISTATAVAAGEDFSLALLADGTLQSWGCNSLGQLGDGTIHTLPNPLPLTVLDLTGVTAVAAGGSHALALLTDQTVWAWGSNSAGQLGHSNSGQLYSSRPVAAVGLEGVSAICAGGDHSAALTADGAVWAWGENDLGQLGDGTTTRQYAPVAISGLAVVDGVGAGLGHTVARVDPAAMVVSVTASDPTATELGATTGEFTLTRYGSTLGDLTVNFSLGGTAAAGTDYTASDTVSIVIPDGLSSVTVLITPVADALAEGNETAVLTVSADPAYRLGMADAATVTITDAPLVTLTVTDAAAAESGADPAVFTISRLLSLPTPLTVPFALTGTAGAGDYTTSATGSVTIPAGATSATFQVTPVVDALVEGDETVILNLAPGAAFLLTDGTQLVAARTATAIITDLPAVSLTASDPNAAEAGLDPGEFTFVRTGSVTSDLTVKYSLTGTAISTDYAVASRSQVVIPAGSASAKVTVTPAFDQAVELPETVILTLAASPTYAANGSASAVLTIADAPTVTVAATTPDASEVGPQVGVFTLTRTGDLTGGLVVSCKLTGTATAADYTASAATTAVFAAGSATTAVTITPVADTAVEPAETVILTVNPGANSAAGSAYAPGTPKTATVTITDQPALTLTASDPNAAESGADVGVFTITRSGALTAPLTVNFVLTGTADSSDYNTSALNSLTLAAGQASGTVTITPIDDQAPEGAETVVLTLTAGDYGLGSTVSAVVTITDAPVVTVAATDPSAAELGAATGYFTVTRSGALTLPLTVGFTLSGTATAGDYAISASSSVTIPAGTASAKVTVTPVADLEIEGDETVILSLASGADYWLGTENAATVTIADLPTVTVAAGNPTANEVGPVLGTFVVTRTGDLAAALAVRYVFAGTADYGKDYLSSPSTVVTIPAGSSSAEVKITPLVDQLVEGAETVVLTLTPQTTYNLGAVTNATVGIADAPTVTVAATAAEASEVGAVAGVFTLTRGGDTTLPLAVSFRLSGTATASDYTASVAGSVTISAGSATATVTITPVADQLVEKPETVVLTLSTGTGYMPDDPKTATVTITDAPTVTVSATQAYAVELGQKAGVFTLTRGGALGAPLQVNYQFSGTATTADYTASAAASATIPAGSATTTVTITPLVDELAENSETVILTLAPGVGYAPGTPNSATITLIEAPVVTVRASPAKTYEAGGEPGAFILTRTGPTDEALPVGFGLTGTAGAGDYTASAAASVTIPAGSATAEVTISALADEVAEKDETVVITLLAGTGYVLGTKTATVSIGELTIITVAASDAAAAEAGGDPGVFTLTRSGSASAALTVNLTWGGTAGSGDYSASAAGSVAFAAGKSTVTVTVTPVDDAVTETTETVLLTVSGGTGYAVGAVGSATVSIADNDYDPATDPVAQFVARFYQYCLLRNPDEAGLNSWVTNLKSGATTGADVGAGFIFSAEFQARNLDSAAWLEVLYQAFFGRASDAAGLAGWQAQLGAGKTRLAVVDGFTHGQEFVNLCGQYGITPYATSGQTDPVALFVSRFYRICLLREPDQNGLAAWVDNLKGGASTGTDVAAGFFFGAEFQARALTDGEFVDAAYSAFFDRSADAAGRAGWLGQLQSGASRLTVISGFSQGAEFSALCGQYGIRAY